MQMQLKSFSLILNMFIYYLSHIKYFNSDSVKYVIKTHDVIYAMFFFPIQYLTQPTTGMSLTMAQMTMIVTQNIHHARTFRQLWTEELMVLMSM